MFYLYNEDPILVRQHLYIQMVAKHGQTNLKKSWDNSSVKSPNNAA